MHLQIENSPGSENSICLRPFVAKGDLSNFYYPVR